MKLGVRKIVNKLGIDFYKYTNTSINPIVLNEKYRKIIEETVFLFEHYHNYKFPLNETRIELLHQLIGTNISEALSILHCLNLSLKNEGDICEFGVAQGSTSTLMANEINSLKGKNLWLFDSFEGLPKPTEKDLLKDDIFNLGSMEAYQGTMACGLNMVSSRLKAIEFSENRTKVVAGFIENTIKYDNLPKKVCFAYVDFDFYEPIKIALEFLLGRMDKGSYIIVDDYDWFSTGAKTAVDEFVNAFSDKVKLTVANKTLGYFAIIEIL
jgi:hypothetical protein